SGYFLIVPEDEVTELDWSPEQALQTIISAGLTAPAEGRYFKPGTAPRVKPAIAGAAGEVPPQPGGDGGRPGPAKGKSDEGRSTNHPARCVTGSPRSAKFVPMLPSISAGIRASNLVT